MHLSSRISFNPRGQALALPHPSPSSTNSSNKRFHTSSRSTSQPRRRQDRGSHLPHQAIIVVANIREAAASHPKPHRPSHHHFQQTFDSKMSTVLPLYQTHQTHPPACTRRYTSYPVFIPSTRLVVQFTIISLSCPWRSTTLSTSCLKTGIPLLMKTFPYTWMMGMIACL